MHILFFDFDGTLRVPETNRISDVSKKSLETLRKKGHRVFINTGRSYESIKNLIQDIPLDGIICGCGTYIRMHGKVLYDTLATAQQVQQVIDAIRKHQVDVLLEGSQGLYYENLYGSNLRRILPLFKAQGTQVLQWTEDTQRFSKMGLTYTSEAQRDAFEAGLVNDWDFISFPDLKAEAVLKGHSKGEGIQRLLDLLDLPVSQSICFGDSDNDIDMFQVVGKSVLIGEESAHLKPYVDIVAPPAREEGITVALEQLKLL